MEYPVIYKGESVGCCILKDDGLYWSLECRCKRVSDLVERLYCGPKNLGVLVPEEDQMKLRKRLSKKSYQFLPPVSGCFGLRPGSGIIPWEGRVMGQNLRGFRLGDDFLYPYDPQQPCPCEALFCFFEICDGFWRLPIFDQ